MNVKLKFNTHVLRINYLEFAVFFAVFELLLQFVFLAGWRNVITYN